MPITINGSGTITGASTLATPVASPTLTTPNINSAQFATVTGTAPIYPCRAWVNFNGTGTVAIRASGNVTSITDNGLADYTVNFTVAISDADYAACITVGINAAPGYPRASVAGYQLAGSYRFITVNGDNNAAADADRVQLAFFR